MTYLTSSKSGTLLRIILAPRASRTKILGIHNDRLKIAVSSPPVEGAANEALIRLLAKTFKVPRSQMTIVAGERSRSKTVEIAGASPQEIARVILICI